eukprot:353941-Chlamydomonas_euryale.AAC.4
MSPAVGAARRGAAAALQRMRQLRLCPEGGVACLADGGGGAAAAGVGAPARTAACTPSHCTPASSSLAFLNAPGGPSEAASLGVLEP